MADIDDEWKEAVRAKLRARDLDQLTLAMQIGASPSAVSHALKAEADGGGRQSRIAADISRHLEIPLPFQRGDLAEIAAFYDDLRRIKRSNRTLYDGIVNTLRIMLGAHVQVGESPTDQGTGELRHESDQADKARTGSD